ncbi:Arc family DNA-binding protein [Sphingosinicella soli]|uniref:Plasmid stability protein n=1 Tax=Sphingosinicella soli TaxID=333708 RepID=A0A7W7F8L9_9SPHN|nr:Arc family DNA-binding protein [Sphingosinicella soli]MBB4633787.1 plasmid stability protein [Sphingosinicella soli]
MKLRLPADLKVMLKERAAANHRKMNGELVAILERALTSQQGGA